MSGKRPYVWAPGAGWVRRAESEKFRYEGLGDGWVFFMAACRWFPDFLADLCRSEDANYELPILHRINMRAKANYQYVDLTEGRGAGKSHSSLLEEDTEQLTWPGLRSLYIGPSNKQTASIGVETHRAIEHDYPLLTDHFVVESSSKGDFQISTNLGSKLSITGRRGINLHKCVAEELAQTEGVKFDEDDYIQIVLPAVRLPYTVKGKKSPAYIPYKQHSITSAGRRQSYAYENRCRHLTMMQRGESAFVMDVPYDVLLLNQMRPVSWAESRKAELTPDQFARELCSLYTGTDAFPMVSDSTLTDCRTLLMTEFHNCLKDQRDDDITPGDVLYVVGYDVSYADGPANAKCACVVIKCTKQRQLIRRDKYLKQIVYVDDWKPATDMQQALRIKKIWHNFCFDSAMAYLAVDAWQFGSAVCACLMQEIGDGLPPLCSWNHEYMSSIELPGALPVLYPIKAGGLGVTDPDQDMVRYAQTQFEYRNVQLLTSNWQTGVESYKKFHRIKDDRSDADIYAPYKKTNELVGQIQNLKVINGVEKRISSHIQRDSWSALKYALRVAQRLEWKNLVKRQTKSDYDELLKQFRGRNGIAPGAYAAGRAGGRLITPRRVGRIV